MPIPVPQGDDSLAQHFEFARRLASSLVTGADGEDLLQDAYVAALQHPPRDPDAGRAYLRSIVQRKAGQQRRSSRRRVARERCAAEPAQPPAPDELAAAMEMHRVVVDEVTQLAPQYREIVLLRFVEDLSPRAIARRLGVPVETARTRIKRAIAQLRSRLDHHRTNWRAALAPLALPASDPNPLRIMVASALAAVMALVLLVIWLDNQRGDDGSPGPGPSRFELQLDADGAPVSFGRYVTLRLTSSDGRRSQHVLYGTSPFALELAGGNYSAAIDPIAGFEPTQPFDIAVTPTGGGRVRVELRRN